MSSKHYQLTEKEQLKKKTQIALSPTSQQNLFSKCKNENKANLL